MNSQRERNNLVDIIRGLAMLLVVLGHTMTGCTTGSYDSFLYGIVWSIQMPLFILVSGYVTRYSREIENFSDLLNFIKRRSRTYMFPWFVWSILIRGCIFGQHDFLNIKWLLWHMDSGYWFLATIWTISVIFGISSFLAKRIAKEGLIRKQIIILVSYIIGMTVLAGVGITAGLTFFAIKLTLYYMPFFFTGYLYGQIGDRILKTENGQKATDTVIAICLLVWLALLVRFNLFTLHDNGIWIILRAFASLTGCIAVGGLCKGLFNNKYHRSMVSSLLSWFGIHSLEIYLSHYLLLSLIKTAELPLITSIQGIALVVANYLLTICFVYLLVKALNTNRTLCCLLFGKTV